MKRSIIVVAVTILMALSVIAQAQSMPLDEKQFITVIETARTAYNAAPNDMLKGVERVNRKKAIRSALPKRIVSGWIGKVIKLDSTGKDAKGIFGVSIAKDISIKTWNNTFSDTSFETLIESDSSLFKVVSSMKVGDMVRFSGEFFDSQEDCAKESSVTTSGSMNDPEFIFRFSRVEPLPK